MKRAVALARKGSGWVNPNPMVGAVIVKEGRIIGEGYHEHFGAPHAEVNAFANATESVADATLYVTLEPCSHLGKTPPCAPLIVEKGIKRVVIGMPDPNPAVNGKGAELLQAHGIEVVVGVLEEEAQLLNEIFIKYITTRQPFALLKTAMTLDGKIATVTNASRWISGEKSRKLVHELRQRFSGILVGVDTVIYDDPILNTRWRSKNNRDPLKIVADTRARIPLESKVLTNNPQLTIIATSDLAEKTALRKIERIGAQTLICPLKNDKIDPVFLFQALGTMGIDSILVEGGSTLAFSLLTDNLIDKVVTFISPKILGGKNAPTPVGGAGIKKMENALQLKSWQAKSIGGDLMIEGYLS
jgi:diaminohydroxyphosphoribosylaminopyrimidine deaminase/5-amino-6-(5-phosphoribosylamino)uracil reductase